MPIALPEPLPRLVRSDIRAGVVGMSKEEARFLVDFYYQIQDNRKIAAERVRAAGKDGEPAAFIKWMFDSMETVEDSIKKSLDDFSSADPIGRWSKSITGIGPVIAAGLLAHIDIEKAPTVGHIWRFAGLDPTMIWKKGKKRPWNAALKVLCWKIGESFVKVSTNPKDFYGRIYVSRKRLEEDRNAREMFAQQAEDKLKRFKIGKTTEAYKHYSEGRLPPAHIHARAKRYAMKLFLSHWHHVAYKVRFGKEPPNPYPLEHMEGHNDLIQVPNLDLI